MTTPHRIENPPLLAPPSGFAHAVAAAPGRLVFLGGQTAHGPDGVVQGRTLVEQFEKTAENVVIALAAVGARPEHLVSIQIYVANVSEYRAALGDLAAVYRRHLGRHYPAIALVGVHELFDPRALVELVCTAVVPDDESADGGPRASARPGP
jgi:enamine deaminase RidA (YjgF/YER057c/UK114 family)